MSIVLAFSGGLDTSYCVVYLRAHYGADVHTVTVNTGGFSPDALDALEDRAYALGAASHTTVQAEHELYQDHLSYLIKGNVLRGQVYPLCVGPERFVQAAAVVRVADAVVATAIAHGSTGAGNDQVRFDGALRALAPSLDILTPIRAQGLSRQASTRYLEERGHEVPAATTAYSINRGLWGNTIGGAETLTTHAPLPEAAYEDTTAPADAPATPARLAITFEEGLPTAVDGEAMDGVALVKHLHAVGAGHGIGRGMHVGDTILGIKGRVGFEAPAATILITAHRELEKVVLTQAQQRHKAYLAEQYGALVHEGHYLDPVLKDIEAFLDSSQRTVSGEVTVELHQGRLQVLGCTSPFSLFDQTRAAYGEANEAWDGRDARGFSRIYGLQAEIAHHVHQKQATHA